MDTTPPPSPRSMQPSAPQPITLPGFNNAPKMPDPDSTAQTPSRADLTRTHALTRATDLPPTPRPAAILITPATPPGTLNEHPARKHRAIQRWLTHRERANRADVPTGNASGSSSTANNSRPVTRTSGTNATAEDRQTNAVEDDARHSRANHDDEDSAVVDDDGPAASYSDSETEIDSVDSDCESTDEEFGKSDNPRMDPKTRADLEAIVFEGKENTTLRYKADWEKAKKHEDLYVKNHRLNKYAWDMVAGGVNQMTSFGVGGIVVAVTGNPWLFPIVSCIASDLVGDRLAQVIRKSTIVTHATKEHLENHRRCARALGDLIESCAGKDPKKKFLVTTGTDDSGKPIRQKMTAAEALEHYGRLNAIGAWGKNLLVRGLPFVWFTGLYSMRDYYLNYRCYNTFFPTPTNSSSGMPPVAGNQTGTNSGCPNPTQFDPEVLRWAMILIGGALAGAMTNLTNQLISSAMPGEERTNYSGDTWKLQVTYLESARIDTKLFLDRLATDTYRKELQSEGGSDEQIAVLEKAAQSLKGIQEKELALARKKASRWTTYQAELDQATQKHRDETVITPEFGGNRLSLFLSSLGKFASLLAYAHFLGAYNFRNAQSDNERLQDILLVPMSLIVLGYAFRDDLRLVGHLPYGVVKGISRACKSPPAEGPDADVTTSLLGVTVDGDTPQKTNSVRNDHDNDHDDDDDDNRYQDARGDEEANRPEDSEHQGTGNKESASSSPMLSDRKVDRTPGRKAETNADDSDIV